MLEVTQTRLAGGVNDPPGNCWTACLAGLLELPLEAVPDEAEFWQPGMKPIQSWRPYMQRIHRWLHIQGYILATCSFKNLEFEGPADCHLGFCIVSGPSPRNSGLHAVIGNLQGEIVFDPHPSRAGLAGDPEKDWMFEVLIKHCFKGGLCEDQTTQSLTEEKTHSDQSQEST